MGKIRWKTMILIWAEPEEKSTLQFQSLAGNKNLLSQSRKFYDLLVITLWTLNFKLEIRNSKFETRFSYIKEFQTEKVFKCALTRFTPYELVLKLEKAQRASLSSCFIIFNHWKG